MRLLLPGLASVILIGALASPVSASTLTEKKYETSFAFSYDDTDDVGKSIDLDGQFQWIFGDGRHEIGPKVTYFKFDPDLGPSTDGLLIGPVYTWNWMPAKDKATGFLEAAYEFASGDLGDVADAAWEASVGAKVFVGDSAAIRFDYYFRSLMGADSFDDQDSSGVRVGLSIFCGK
ncbi:MAG TPA: hypothetical protein VGR38_01070 [Candidatus Polarisedimenticolia bacterium]|jgi:hypothetical protein|nr:hypothetical protein [Candidatus Polarisedimenticolia bacterium]